jgi:putative transposase
VHTSTCRSIEISATAPRHISPNTPQNEGAPPVTLRATPAVMPRAPRLQIAGLTQHVLNRGNNRCDIFQAQRDYAFFLFALREAALKYVLDVHSYALMTNHFHLVVTPRQATAVSMVMQVAVSRYVAYFNRRYERTGTLFEGPFKSMFIDSERYWFTCMRYVELNPVRAGLVSDPSEYRWSSYRANALGVNDEVIVPHSLYLALGESSGSRQRSWRELCRDPIPSEQLLDIRELVHRGGVLGDEPVLSRMPRPLAG